MIEIREKKLVTMANSIIRARWSPLNINEMRLLWCILGQMPPVSKEDPDSFLQEINPDKPYYITKADFVRLGATPNHVARDIRNACKEFKEKSVFLPTPFGELQIGWVDTVLHFKSSVFEELKKKYPNSKYDEEFLNQLRLHNLLETLPKVMESDENLIARVTLTKNIIPYIAQLRRDYTALGFDEVAGFTSFYTFKLFFILMQFKDEKTQSGTVFYRVEDFRHDFNLDDKYKKTGDLVKKVIEPALAEIEKNTSFEVSFTPMHGNKKVKGTQKITVFSFKYKKITPALAAKSSWQEKGLSDKQIAKLAVFYTEFIDKNNDPELLRLGGCSDTASYHAVFESWKPFLKEPEHLSKFQGIQDFLDR
ncbi:replication initiation protein [Moraxella bovoculi]|uniref:replication initiation protein n=1 Tax=Moraxella bovoculi TaxID=386891 RepID=UPI0009BC40AD|nr:replication initiation protein [Moraxella bovoculi]